MSPRIKAVYDRVIAMMAAHISMEPAVDLADHTACAERWREQRVAEIAIQEFGPEAKALAQTELHQVAGEAERAAIPHVPYPLSMVDHRDGGCLSSKPEEAHHAA